MNAQRLQGILFSLLAVLVALAALALGRFAPQMELIVLAALIVVLGIPHGALDTIFAHRLYGIRTLWDWLRFAVIYLLLAVLVVGLWKFAPILFLLCFLLISVAHFSGDPAEGNPLVSRILYAGAVIIFPNFLHGAEITRIFAQLVGSPAATAVAPGLAWLAWPWAIGLVLAVLECVRRDWLTALEMTSVGVLTFLAPPLVSFTVFFCGMHSARHIIRTVLYSGHSSLRLLMAAALLPMLGVLLASAVAWHFLKNTPLDARVLQIVFVGLAALTVPHMMLVERVRLSGWLKGTAK
jgi:Brp/Blh family beta-carotene 15,15'-monooxygenase